ncbi:MAG: RNA methyltransferase [Actinobacteria bacterium]|nr:RNA methyltransferase [Actinomycetota bacterium]
MAPLAFTSNRVQRLRKLVNEKSERIRENAFVVEGQTLIRDAVRAGCVVESQFIAPGARAVPATSGEVYELAQGVLERVASTSSPQPVVAIVKKPTRTQSEISAQRDAWVVVADRVADPGNLGTILRSAEAAGASAVFLTPGSAEAYAPKVVRASAGAIFNIPVYESANLRDIRNLGFQIWGTSSHADQNSVDYRDADLSGRVAIVLGNEAHGLASTEEFDGWLTISHSGRGESLNVAMAATLLCFELKRQREN